jgi:hypothetical protein
MNNELQLDQALNDLTIKALTYIPGLPLELVSMASEKSQSFGFKSFRFNFCMIDSPVTLKFSIAQFEDLEYSYQTTFVKSPKVYFSFADYLKYIHSPDFSAVSRSKSMRLENYLAILLKYLQQDDLKKVVTGEEWIEVPFDWESIGR